MGSMLPYIAAPLGSVMGRWTSVSHLDIPWVVSRITLPGSPWTPWSAHWVAGIGKKPCMSWGRWKWWKWSQVRRWTETCNFFRIARWCWISSERFSTSKDSRFQATALRFWVYFYMQKTSQFWNISKFDAYPAHPCASDIHVHLGKL